MNNTMSELAVGSNQIIQNLGLITTITDDVESSSVEMKLKTSKITDAIRTINEISSDTSKEIESIAISVHNLNTKMEKVAESGITNNESVVELEKIVSAFKIK